MTSVSQSGRLEFERAYLDSRASQPEPQILSPEERAVILETLYEIDAMLARLPPKVRNAFLMA